MTERTKSELARLAKVVASTELKGILMTLAGKTCITIAGLDAKMAEREKLRPRVYFPETPIPEAPNPEAFCKGS